MAVRVKLTMKGFEQYLEQIAQTGRDIDAVTDRALLAGAQVLQAGMKHRAPKDTHNLEEHIKINGPEQNGNYHSIEVGVIHDKEFTDAETARYAVAQEYGWISKKAHQSHPFIRPTLDNDKAAAQRAMKKVFTEELGL